VRIRAWRPSWLTRRRLLCGLLIITALEFSVWLWLGPNLQSVYAARQPGWADNPQVRAFLWDLDQNRRSVSSPPSPDLLRMRLATIAIGTIRMLAPLVPLVPLGLAALVIAFTGPHGARRRALAVRHGRWLGRGLAIATGLGLVALLHPRLARAAYKTNCAPPSYRSWAAWRSSSALSLRGSSSPMPVCKRLPIETSLAKDR